ncbi:uncharacterized protein JN550_009023 [Neoarthrinium moseri]|uniref:uncharacterized protein n=1 Tax=Neoarthrinium moseri TaxID=1658444 RepID=UPI001FDDAFA7|nr:uncharacterized protein JN550_009023 [Neoarthrinium moseri]KAI1864466.1 hypothetical protein JN550_009023 [Neoarthrinium moseri]
MLAAKSPFVLHAVIETFAALSFIFGPEKQIPGCSPATKLVLKQYGGLLLSSNLVCLVVLLQDRFGSTERMLAAALGFYHLWPIHRALVRIVQRAPGDAPGNQTLGGPLVHLGVHVVVFALFLYVSLFPGQ